MTGARQRTLRQVVATGGAIALLTTMAACGSDKKDAAAAAPAPSVAAADSPAPDASASPSATAPADSGPAAGKGGGAVNVRSVHLTEWAWSDPATKDPVVALIKAGKIDNVEIDIKDEDGLVGYDSKVPLAVQAGTVYLQGGKPRFDINATVKEIHDLGATLTGRIVTFRDPKLGKWALNNGHMDYLIQNTSGGPYNAGSYGTASFTNFANKDIIEYNAALGEEAAKAGFDAIMYDYVRKPENNGQVYPGIGDKSPSQAIADFVGTAAARIHAAGASAGAAVFGVSAFTPTLIAQDISLMAPHLDFISPMIYPSHWGKGEYSVDSPVNQPYEIVKRSLMDFNRQVLGTHCAVVPWLQNFSWPIPYSADDVAAQIRAAKDVGINGFYLWNDSSKVGLGAPALVSHDKAGDAPGDIHYSINKPGNASDGTTDEAKAKAYIDAYRAWVAAGKVGTFVSPVDGGAGTATASPDSSSSASSSSPAPSATATP